MEAIIDGFFSAYDFGNRGDGAHLVYQHYDESEGVAVFRAAGDARLEVVEPLVAAAVEKLARSYPELATLSYRIET